MNNDNFADYDLIDIKRSKEKETMIFAELLALVWKYKWLYVASIILFLCIGVYKVRTTPKMYMRSATVLIKNAGGNSGMTESEAFSDMMSQNSKSIENEIGMFKSRKLALRVVEELQLDVSYRNTNLKETEIYTKSPVRVKFLDEDITGQIRLFVKNHNGTTTVKLLDPLNGQKSPKTYVTLGGMTRTLLGRCVITLDSVCGKDVKESEVIVTRLNPKSVASYISSSIRASLAIKNSSLLTLSIVDENAQRAEDILNTLVDVYNADNVNDRNNVIGNTSNFIDEQLAVIKADLDGIDSDMEAFMKDNQLTNLNSEGQLFIQNNNNIENQGLSVDNKINMAEYMKSYLIRNGKNSDMIPASVGIADDGIQAVIIDYNKKVERRNRYLANSSPDNPLVLDLDQVLEEQRRSLLRAIDNILTSLKVQSINMNKQEAETNEKISDLPTYQKQLASIQRQQKIKEELYLYLLNKKQENELQQTLTESNCKVVDAADGPWEPVSPNKMQIFLICIIAGLVLPSLYIYVCTLLNTKVLSREDLRGKLSVPFLGELPLDKKRERNDIMLNNETDHSLINESFRIIRENLRFMRSVDKPDNPTILHVMSLNEDSGKSFVAVNLAANTAILGKRVIILDLDLRHTSLTHRLGVSTMLNGISNYLAGGCDSVAQIIQNISSDLYSFDFIPSGTVPPNPSELLRSERFDQLIATLKEEYDYIILDNPPYGIVVDPIISARVTDQTIFVMRSREFDKRMLTEVEELYTSEKFPHMSVLLNGVDFDKLAYKYKYRYNYGYTYGHQKGKRAIVDRLRTFIKA